MQAISYYNYFDAKPSNHPSFVIPISSGNPARSSISAIIDWMAAITTSSLVEPAQLRPLNVLRDLPGVADLVEKCFTDTIDSEGRHYLQQMRRAGQDNAFMRWASNAVDSVSMPLSGYVWEENGEIIGNVSLIPYRHKKKKIYLIANVAVRPDFRRRGIGRALTAIAMNHANQRHADATWLHVRADNPGAIALYANLGFQEFARRTMWQAKPDMNATMEGSAITIQRRSSRDWPQQESWLSRLYPNLMTWYQAMPWRSLRPGIGPLIYRFVMEYDVRHWVVRIDNALSAILSWQAMTEKNDRLWAAVPPEGSEHALTALLINARRSLPWRQTLILDYPAGEYSTSIEAAGFHPQRTLLWMKLQEANPVNHS
jgi:ribosomal protein S18 acetylase RimI-like enzyme